jgi:hypothetical protein
MDEADAELQSGLCRGQASAACISMIVATFPLVKPLCRMGCSKSSHNQIVFDDARPNSHQPFVDGEVTTTIRIGICATPSPICGRMGGRAVQGNGIASPTAGPGFENRSAIGGACQ